MERKTCPSCTKEFTAIRGEYMCAICADPEGFRRFCESLDKEIRERSVREERNDKRAMRAKFTS